MELPIWRLRRYHLLLLTFIGNMLAYMVRFSFNVTVIDMTNVNNTNFVNWTKGDIAQIQAAFFYGYCSSCALFGLFADRVGPRIIIGKKRLLVTKFLKILLNLNPSWEKKHF